jgi:hypothetical protein
MRESPSRKRSLPPGTAPPRVHVILGDPGVRQNHTSQARAALACAADWTHWDATGDDPGVFATSRPYRRDQRSG